LSQLTSEEATLNGLGAARLRHHEDAGRRATADRRVAIRSHLPPRSKFLRISCAIQPEFIQDSLLYASMRRDGQDLNSKAMRARLVVSIGRPEMTSPVSSFYSWEHRF
jgi:hypothetical protein